VPIATTTTRRIATTTSAFGSSQLNGRWMAANEQGKVIPWATGVNRMNICKGGRLIAEALAFPMKIRVAVSIFSW